MRLHGAKYVRVYLGLLAMVPTRFVAVVIECLARNLGMVMRAGSTRSRSSGPAHVDDTRDLRVCIKNSRGCGQHRYRGRFDWIPAR
jgi:hypothetical protein